MHITDEQAITLDKLVKCDYAISRVFTDGIIQCKLRADTSIIVHIRKDGTTSAPATSATMVQSSALRGVGIVIR